MKRLLTLIFLSTLICLMYATPQLPDTCGVSMPSILSKKTITESETKELLKYDNWEQFSNSHKYWTVYSDRSHNFTYSLPSEQGEICDTLVFNEQVRIAKIENGYALVYTEPQKTVTFPLISSSAKSRGWILMDNLLLWSSCPTTETGIYNKALILFDIDEQAKRNSDVGKIYQNPMTKEGSRALAPDMVHYFVMKKADNGLILLARECKMEGFTSQVLYGWVSTSSYVPWSQRICLEPNWHLLETEPLKGKTANVYNKDRVKSAAIPLCQINPQTKNSTTKYRWDSLRMRFPLLEEGTENENQYHVVAYCSSQECGIPYLMIGDSANTFAFEGYVDKQMDGVNLWKTVLYISSDELAQLMEKLQPLMNAAETGERKAYIEALKELARAMIPDITPQEMDEKDVKEILSLVAGLNVKKSSLGGRTLIQIQNNKIVGDDEFDEIIKDFRNKYNKLKKIRENKYYFSVERNKTTWYWIPVEDLP